LSWRLVSKVVDQLQRNHAGIWLDRKQRQTMLRGYRGPSGQCLASQIGYHPPKGIAPSLCDFLGCEKDVLFKVDCGTQRFLREIIVRIRI
jgi:hypothetical protein